MFIALFAATIWYVPRSMEVLAYIALLGLIGMVHVRRREVDEALVKGRWWLAVQVACFVAALIFVTALSFGTVGAEIGFRAFFAAVASTFYALIAGVILFITLIVLWGLAVQVVFGAFLILSAWRRGDPSEALISLQNDQRFIAVFGGCIVAAAIIVVTTVFDSLSAIAANAGIAALLYAIAAFPWPLIAVGLIHFLGTRLFLLIFSIWHRPLTTIRLIPYVWVSRQFAHSVFDRIELVPGYQIHSVDLSFSISFVRYLYMPTFISMKDGKTREKLHRDVWGSLVWARAFFPPPRMSLARISLVAACVLSRPAFKLSAPILFPMIYLLSPIAAKDSGLHDSAVRHAQSSFKQWSVAAAIFTVALFVAKCVAYINFDQLVFSPRFQWLAHIITPSHITLWQLASLASAILFLAYTREADLALFRANRNGEKLPTWRLRGAGVGRAVRDIAALYSTACVIIICIPQLRGALFWLVDIKVIALP